MRNIKWLITKNGQRILGLNNKLATNMKTLIQFGLFVFLFSSLTSCNGQTKANSATPQNTNTKNIIDNYVMSSERNSFFLLKALSILNFNAEFKKTELVKK